MAAVNNSDSELNLKKGFLVQYTLKQIFVDTCIPPPSPPQKEKPHLHSSFFNTDNEDVVYE